MKADYKAQAQKLTGCPGCPDPVCHDEIARVAAALQEANGCGRLQRDAEWVAMIVSTVSNGYVARRLCEAMGIELPDD